MTIKKNINNVEDLKRKFEKFKGIKPGHLDTKIMAMQYERKGKPVRDLYEEIIHFAYCQGKMITNEHVKNV